MWEALTARLIRPVITCIPRAESRQLIDLVLIVSFLAGAREEFSAGWTSRAAVFEFAAMDLSVCLGQQARHMWRG
jgi:hypothetical protein